ncbi:GNAT family N-acetyltransferase [uncultured Arthrobacter sp.]|uniref:GNAT family N-acetyltransferase n=1 Tax=uncultured Arthrobacter sp. TaxID=114050 RepID=UPI0025F10B18|nr:GNAT family N-acetyltransferase [uncultured Arthrobacter sp.]
MIAALPLPDVLSTNHRTFRLRRVAESDLGALMFLLSDDPISAARGDRFVELDSAAYLSALKELTADSSNEVLLVVDDRGDAVATMQLTRIPGLSRGGATRLLVEAVRVRSIERSSGIGSAMMRWVTTTAAAATGASLVQLTSDQEREGAHRFYERLGFVGSHRGFKFQVQ